MEEFDKEKSLEELFAVIAKIGSVNNPITQMKETLKLADWIESIYKKGFTNGFIKGKEAKLNELTKNN